MNLIFVFLGGMAGAILRYEISHRWNGKNDIPWGTAVANFSGGLFLGFLIHSYQQTGFQDWLWLLLATGFCGGYTTYSTFSYEVVQLAQEGKWWKAVLYMAGSISMTILGVMILV